MNVTACHYFLSASPNRTHFTFKDTKFKSPTDAFLLMMLFSWSAGSQAGNARVCVLQACT